MATSNQISMAAGEVRGYFGKTAGATSWTTGGAGVTVHNRTLDAAQMRAMDRITKKYGCTYHVAPSVSSGDAGFQILLQNE